MPDNPDLPEVPKGHALAYVRMIMPQELLAEFIQHVRDFDARHYDDVKLTMAIEAPGMDDHKAEGILRKVDPPFDSVGSAPRKKKN